jgi:V-type H+-transporting ATPase proteolipid subunit
MVTDASAINLALFVKILVIEVFSSILGLFGLIIGLLVVSRVSSSPSTMLDLC